MTNNWVDMDNSSLYYIQGANPVENHPAAMGHVNNGRFDLHSTGPFGRKATMVVVDPRQTRTAKQINPANGDRYIRIRPGTDIAFINAVMNQIFTRMYEANANPADLDHDIAVNFFAWHNGDASGSTANRGFTADDGNAVTVNNWPKYCDSRLIVNSAGDDYERETRTADAGSGTRLISNFPVLGADVDVAGCVLQKLRAHVAVYTSAVAADICGCLATDIEFVADKFIKNSRFADDMFEANTGLVGGLGDPARAGYRATTIMYAMGITQHTCGSQNIRDYAMLQTMMGNMGRAGGGVNALRGIHNVQGSTDFGLLFDAIPGYSANPGTSTSFGAYVNTLYGYRIVPGTSPATSVLPTYGPYIPGTLGLQQRGFYNMTREWFGNRDVSASGDIDSLWSMWPKGNGIQHILAFRKMLSTEPEATRIKALVNWGQNPAITEPNQSFIRQALYDLDLLVCVDTFAQETAQAKRKTGGKTYLLPACSYVEEAGSVTSSGRWMQWRDRAVPPKGNSKSDLELLLRFAKELNTAGAFSHIKDVWKTMSGVPSLYNGASGADPFTVLYAKYGWDGSDASGGFEGLTGTDAEGVALVGSEVVAENLYKEICSPVNAASGVQGTMWIYAGNSTTNSGYSIGLGDTQPACGAAWTKANRAKSRNSNIEFTSRQFPRYGYAWLLNRRIFYNNGELPGDISDNFVAPGLLSRLFVNNTNTMADWSSAYRKYSTLSDKPDTLPSALHVLPGRFPAHTEPYESPRPDLVATFGKNTSGGTAGNLVPATTAIGLFGDSIADPTKFDLVLTTIRCVEHFQGGPTTRNNPWNHEMEPEPWVEINSVDALKFGIKDGDWVDVVTARGNSTSDQQGRTKVDADSDSFAKGFKARVGVGTLANQRVAPGVVAIPWHWGERGLSKGSRANDLCIDAWDANTTIPESKACLCRIRKVGA